MDDGKKGAVILASAAFLVGIAIMMNIFACTLMEEKNMYPLLILFLQLIVPLPLALFGLRNDRDNYEGGLRTSVGFGWFLTGAFLSMAFSIPLTMLHEGSISGQQLGLIYGSQVMTYGIFAAAGIYQKRKKEYSTI